MIINCPSGNHHISDYFGVTSDYRRIEAPQFKSTKVQALLAGSVVTWAAHRPLALQRRNPFKSALHKRAAQARRTSAPHKRRRVETPASFSELAASGSISVNTSEVGPPSPSSFFRIPERSRRVGGRAVRSSHRERDESTGGKSRRRTRKAHARPYEELARRLLSMRFTCA